MKIEIIVNDEVDKHYTLNDLKDKLINELCNKDYKKYTITDIEVIKILFEEE